MPLSCDCGEWDGEGVGYLTPDDFKHLIAKRSRRCKSCNAKIKPGQTCLEFERFHYPQDDIEERIYGDGEEIPNASWHLCVPCGEIFFNLDDLGFCVNPDENMEALLYEYRTEIIKDNGLFLRG